MTDFEEYRNKDSGYKVPEDYFEAKRKQLLDIAGEDGARETRVFRLSFGWIASGIAAALLLGLFIFGPREQSPDPLNLDFSDEVLAEYVLSSYNYELGEELLLMEFEEDDLAGLEINGLTDEDLEFIIDENYDQTLHYEYL